MIHRQLLPGIEDRGPFTDKTAKFKNRVEYGWAYLQYCALRGVKAAPPQLFEAIAIMEGQGRSGKNIYQHFYKNIACDDGEMPTGIDEWEDWLYTFAEPSTRDITSPSQIAEMHSDREANP